MVIQDAILIKDVIIKMVNYIVMNVKKGIIEMKKAFVDDVYLV